MGDRIPRQSKQRVGEDKEAGIDMWAVDKVRFAFVPVCNKGSGTVGLV